MHCWQNLPEKFLNKLDAFLPAEKRNEVLESFCHEKPTVVRVNTLKANREQILKTFKQHTIHVTGIPWYTDAYIVNGNKQQLTHLESYQQGEFYIQNLSSMIPPLILNPQRDEIILDLCAAPGSKTAQIAALMNNTGSIVANDRSRQRLFKLQANLKTQGVTNTKIICSPGEILWKQYPNYFDKVLVDAPCTMEGRFHANDPDSYKDWSPKKTRLLAQSQKWLLRAAFTMTKPGGIVIYSTCTLSPEENEEILDWLLKNEPYPFTVEKIHIPNLNYVPGLTNWNNHNLSNQLKNTLRILPDRIMEGFFVAKIKKEPLALSH